MNDFFAFFRFWGPLFSCSLADAVEVGNTFLTSALAGVPGTSHRTCAHCTQTIYDTAGMTDLEVERLMESEPAACLAVTLT